MLQLNEYETDSYFFQLSQNMTTDCLLIYVFLPVPTCFNCSKNQSRTILGLQQVKTGKKW